MPHLLPRPAALHRPALCCALLLFVACSHGGELSELDWESAGGSEGDPTQGGLGGEMPSRQGASDDESELSLPFAVDEHFVPFGYMGDPITVFDDPNNCMDRPEGAQGRCHAYSFLAAEDDGWRGLYWLSEFNNWGSSPGRRIMSGAQQVSFVAKSSQDGLTVHFLVGGIKSDLAHADSFDVRVPIVLSSEFQRYTLDISAAEYGEGVLGGFGWGIFSADSGRLWIDDIRWE